ncbi:uroporphyrinogen-III C-methyltransferase [Enterococcus florum]|uniref:Uroporphyrinogen-III C-methyltransferase n=1 Tax=Enterococcus florum TaxID=2480627 RepID=A0A4P5PAS4_9ENTE|nr:uroporphyrinogen-III C-methyltransferase [Enterococcus florum]GCF95207.1 uroporphyrinogen-III C-methyltransferase [Enterococcus florum]
MTGVIALVGAGLGDPELLTVKGLRKIQKADVVVYDRLINPAILNSCKPGCEKIYVGKKPQYHPVPQEQIEEIMIEKAQQGKTVVRLKSGDPYVFGRGGEEGASLKQAGISFEVIPGITSSIGGLAYAGIPITHRDLAASFHIYTGHLNNSEAAIDWATAAKSEGTLVFLMGMAGLEEITQQLLKHGKSKETPAAVIQWASRKKQKTVTGTLETIYQKALEKQLQPPSLIVFGEVVERRSELNFFEERPLFGISITVPHTEKKRITSQLTDLGAEVVELPPAVQQLSTQKINVQAYLQVVFTDKASVEMFVQSMGRNSGDWRQLGQLKLITVGHHTGEALKQVGIQPDIQLSTMVECLEILSADTLILGEQQVIRELNEHDTPGTKFVSHTEFLETPLTELWQTTDLLYFPHSKAARLFLRALTFEEKAMLKKKKIIVMGRMTKAVFDQEEIAVIQTKKPDYESVLHQIKEEMNP